MSARSLGNPQFEDPLNVESSRFFSCCMHARPFELVPWLWLTHDRFKLRWLLSIPWLLTHIQQHKCTERHNRSRDTGTQNLRHGTLVVSANQLRVSLHKPTYPSFAQSHDSWPVGSTWSARDPKIWRLLVASFLFIIVPFFFWSAKFIGNKSTRGLELKWTTSRSTAQESSEASWYRVIRSRLTVRAINKDCPFALRRWSWCLQIHTESLRGQCFVDHEYQIVTTGNQHVWYSRSPESNFVLKKKIYSI